MDTKPQKHIFLANIKDSIQFKSKPLPFSTPLPSRDRKAHADYLSDRFNNIWQQSEIDADNQLAVSLPVKNGIYVEFKSHPDFELTTKSLDSTKSEGIKLRNVRQKETPEGLETLATVYLPKDKTKDFVKKLKEYADINTKGGNPKNQKLIESIEDVILASQLHCFWLDSLELMPQVEKEWCEVWLAMAPEENKHEFIAAFQSLCKTLKIEYKEQYLLFPERLIILIKANEIDLRNLIASNDDIAEFRKAQETASFWTNQNNSDQLEWIKDLLCRLNINESNTSIAILDGGINNGHELLAPILSDQDCLTINPEWGINDTHVDGHGTLMAGVAGYNNLQRCLESSLPVNINHKLESIKILPPPTQEENPKELWGFFTAQGISRAEINNPNLRRINCMAVTSAQGMDNGNPSSWSAAVDAIASGADDEQQRLIIVSAGNIPQNEDFSRYPDINKEKSIQNPAQSWNALTVGAYTQKIQINESKYKSYSPLAPADGLSPHSTTSHEWSNNKWPLKPDIVMEGGNMAITPDGCIGDHDDLSSLTTSPTPLKSQFQFINATSEATAHAAWIAAQLQTKYSDAWPETIRALMVHSANWTDTMFNQFDINPSSKTDIKRLISLCGYGVPDFNMAINSFNNSLSMVCQESIQPYVQKENSSDYKINEMHFYKLPWPKEDLIALGATNVKLRITLSYFIEPGPGEVGWKDRYRYASHALRFELNMPTESETDFIKRINIAARDEDYSNDVSDTDRWQVGKKARHRGSIHSDYIECSAADLATCNLIGVYPVIGWWRERKNLKRMEKSSRYSLVISLQTEEEEVDLYTPIITAIKTPVTIAN